jgi:hypothetical protein
MYVSDGQDHVVGLTEFPRSNVGAPCPVVLATEHSLVVSFFLEDSPVDWDGTTVRVLGPDSPGEPAAVVRFHGPYAHFFGPPNDEALSGHPLAKRGLHPYGAFEVLHSSWVRALERMSSVHPYHRPERFAEYRHFVLSFHDSTFECVAKSYSHELGQGPLDELVAKEAARLPV